MVPDGTATAERTIVEHEDLDLLAKEAPFDPVNVHVVALLLISGAEVGAGDAAGAAIGLESTALALERAMTARENLYEGIATVPNLKESNQGRREGNSLTKDEEKRSKRTVKTPLPPQEYTALYISWSPLEQAVMVDLAVFLWHM